MGGKKFVEPRGLAVGHALVLGRDQPFRAALEAAFGQLRYDTDALKTLEGIGARGQVTQDKTALAAAVVRRQVDPVVNLHNDDALLGPAVFRFAFDLLLQGSELFLGLNAHDLIFTAVHVMRRGVCLQGLPHLAVISRKDKEVCHVFFHAALSRLKFFARVVRFRLSGPPFPKAALNDRQLLKGGRVLFGLTLEETVQPRLHGLGRRTVIDPDIQRFVQDIGVIDLFFAGLDNLGVQLVKRGLVGIGGGRQGDEAFGLLDGLDEIGRDIALVIRGFRVVMKEFQTRRLGARGLAGDEHPGLGVHAGAVVAEHRAFHLLPGV